MIDSEESVVFSYRLSVKERNAWKSHCESRYSGMTPSTVAKLLMRKEMGLSLDGSGQPLKPYARKIQAVKSEPSKKTNCVYVYLTDSEAAAVAELAEHSGISKSVWLSRAARASIRFDSEPSPKELNNLIESNHNMKALGRNLNQIARRLNEGQKAELIDLEGIKRSIDHHTKVVSQLIKSCVNRWDLE